MVRTWCVAVAVATVAAGGCSGTPTDDERPHAATPLVVVDAEARLVTSTTGTSIAVGTAGDPGPAPSTESPSASNGDSSQESTTSTPASTPASIPAPTVDLSDIDELLEELEGIFTEMEVNLSLDEGDITP